MTQSTIGTPRPDESQSRVVSGSGGCCCRESQDGALQAHVQSWHDVVRLILRLISNILIVAIIVVIFVSSRLTDRSPD
jgi:hypothetical protein